jgi:methylmalonyl-CoA/ethylmalonyl-CoA epimerase
MNKQLHHVGVVVAQLEKAAAFYARELGATVKLGPIDDPLQKVRVMFLHTGTDVLLELVEPLSPDSPAHRLAQAGGGIHHLCYEVEALDRCLEESRKGGCLVISNPLPATAFKGRRIAFLFTPMNIVIEYLEKEPR